MTSPPNLTPGCARVPVWAPRAERLELDVDGEHRAMVAADGGWWLAPDPLPDGVDYAFIVDGRGPFPDPRAAWLPHGVHGPARTWTPPARLSRPARRVLGDVIYEMHVGTFTPSGTLDAAIERLDHLVDLGIGTVELMPVAAFPGTNGWGYDGVGLYAIHAPYGGPEAYCRFVDAAHERGLAVCQDLVLNHLGPEGNYTGQFGPYFTSRHSTPWGDGFNLDGSDSATVRDYLIGAAQRLITVFDVDALRLDAVHEIIDDSRPHLLQELSDKVRSPRGVTLIAESDLNDYTMVEPTAMGGMGMDAQWDDDIHHALHVEFTSETHAYYSDFAAPGALEKVYSRVFFHDGTHSTFRDRAWGRPVPDSIERRRFIAFTSNHDQVGNRALGDRPQQRLTLAQAAGEAALILLSPFTPMIFMGEEWAASTPFQFFTDFPDPDLARAVSEGRRTEFAGHGWDELYAEAPEVPDPQEEATLRASQLRWDERRDDDHRAMEEWYRRLITLRRGIDACASRLTRTDTLITLEREGLICYVSLSDLAQPLPHRADTTILASFGHDGPPTWLAPKACLVVGKQS